MHQRNPIMVACGNLYCFGECQNFLDLVIMDAIFSLYITFYTFYTSLQSIDHHFGIWLQLTIRRRLPRSFAGRTVAIWDYPPKMEVSRCSLNFTVYLWACVACVLLLTFFLLCCFCVRVKDRLGDLEAAAGMVLEGQEKWWEVPGTWVP